MMSIVFINHHQNRHLTPQGRDGGGGITKGGRGGRDGTCIGIAFTKALQLFIIVLEHVFWESAFAPPKTHPFMWGEGSRPSRHSPNILCRSASLHINAFMISILLKTKLVGRAAGRQTMEGGCEVGVEPLHIKEAVWGRGDAS